MIGVLKQGNQGQLLYCPKIAYITDLHLDKGMRRNSIVQIAETLVQDCYNHDCNILLIGGDVASDYGVFIDFINHLSLSIANYHSLTSRLLRVLFVLGNHEFENYNIDRQQVLLIYREEIRKGGMYLLEDEIAEVTKNSIQIFKTVADIHQAHKCTFCNDKKGVYIYGAYGFPAFYATGSETLKQPYNIQGTNLYSFITTNFNNAIILTHTSVDNAVIDKWGTYCKQNQHITYISGHNHINTQYITSNFYVYRDNQICYTKTDNPKFEHHIIPKYFVCNQHKGMLLQDFVNGYANGIHRIDKQVYVDMIEYLYPLSNYRMGIVDNDIDKFNNLYFLKNGQCYAFVDVNGRGTIQLCFKGAKEPLNKPNYTIEDYYMELPVKMQQINEYMRAYINSISNFQKVLEHIVHNRAFDNCINGVFLNKLKRLGGTLIDGGNYSKQININPTTLDLSFYKQANEFSNVTVYNCLTDWVHEQHQCLELNHNDTSVLNMIKYNFNICKMLAAQYGAIFTWYPTIILVCQDERSTTEWYDTLLQLEEI